VICKIQKDSFLSAQLKWWELPNFYKLMVGGYGSGKTHIGALRAIYLSQMNSEIPGMYVCPSYPMADKTIVATLREIMNRSGLDYTYNETKHRFDIHNWSGTFWIGSGEKPDSLKGATLAWAGIDEPFIQKKAVLQQMTARVRHPKASHREIFLTGTPEELNWGYSLATESSVDIGSVVASTLDNPHLPQEYKDNLLASYSPEEIQAYVHGKFVNLTAGRVCKDFDREKHVVHRTDLQTLIESDAFISADYNVDFMSGLCGVDLSGHVHFFDEFRLSNSNTFELSDAVRAKYPNIRNCYPDATGKARKTSSTKSDHQIMRDAGFVIHCKASNPPVKERVNAWNRLMRDGRITIDPKCKHLIADCELMTWKAGDLNKTSSDPARTHAFDAASYFVQMKHPIRRVAKSVKW
jgi:phage terminase large subunit|tara:strand:+ start:54 stop:1280 length:1227 start_codon:yes stop_codon:yes gene_type:complete